MQIIVRSCVNGRCVVTDNAEAGNEESLDYESRALVQFCQSNSLLLTSYQLLFQLNSALTDSTEVHSVESVKEVRMVLLDFYVKNNIDAFD